MMCRSRICLLLGLALSCCSGQASDVDVVEIVLKDVVVFSVVDTTAVFEDAAVDTTHGDLGGGEQQFTPDVPRREDLPAAVDVLPGDTGSELSEISDLVEELPSVDLQPQDLGFVDAGPCGLCPAHKPLCAEGQCVCSGSSCPGGFYCKGGECQPCNVDMHCGEECVSCASEGKYCSSAGLECVDCDSSHPCPEGKSCVDAACLDCSGLGLCGPNCLECGDQTPDCVEGQCLCNADSCGASQVCEGGVCVACTDTDPAHCGSDCLVCSGEQPHCKQGECFFCDEVAACGPSCAACSGETPWCHPDGTGCVVCVEDLHCGEGFHCDDFACAVDCQAQGCANDLGAGGKKCSDAYVIGRVEASGGVLFSGDTEDQKNDDDLNYFLEHSECWDASTDHFYRVYLMAGETLHVDLAVKADERNQPGWSSGNSCSFPLAST